MQINLEKAEQHTIQSYNEHEVVIDTISYQHSLILSLHEIIPTWPVQAIHQLNDETLAPLLKYHPKIIIVGHNQVGKFIASPIVQKLAEQHIGLESMSIGAACRTFNVLMSEKREVVLGLLLG